MSELSQYFDEPSTESGLGSIFEDALKTAFPVASTVADVYKKVEPAARPYVNAPLTGLGGLVDMAQGNSVQDAAQGIQQGKTVGDYVTQAIPEPETGSVGMNLAGNIGREALGGITNLGVMTGAVEGVTGVKPALQRMTAEARAAQAAQGGLEASRPSPFPDAIETTAETGPTDVGQVFEEALKKPTSVSEVFAKEIGETPKPVDPASLETIDPKTFPRKEPYALYIGEQDLGNGSTTAMYDIHGEHPSAKSTITQETLDQMGLPVLGKAPERPQVDFHSLKSMEQDDEPSLSKYFANERGSVSVPEAPKTPDALTDRLLAESKSSVTGQSAAEEAKNTFLENRNADTFNLENKTRSLEAMVTPDEQRALQFYIQGDKVPVSIAKNEPKVAELIKNPTEAMKKFKEDIRPHYDELHNALDERYNRVGYRPDYAPMYLKMEGKEQLPSYNPSELNANNPNIKAATFPDLATAVDKGYETRSKSAVEDLRTYHKYFAESNNALDLKDSLAGVTDDKGLLMGTKDQVPANYIQIEHPAFKGKYKDRKGVEQQGAMYARPDVYKSIRILVEKPFSNEWFDAAQALNGVMKKAKLSISMFHHFTLTENALASGVMKNLLNPADWVNMLADLGESIQKGGAAFLDPKWTEIGMRNGLTMGGVVGAEEGAIATLVKNANGLLSKVIKDAPEIGASGAIQAEKVWDHVLWRHLQPYFKLMAFKNNSLLMMEKFPNLPPKLVMRQVADYVNGEFGGQMWEKIFSSPHTSKFFSFIQLAMDWNVSNFKNLAGALKGGMSLERTNPFKDNFTWGSNTPQGAIGRSFIMKSLAMFFVGTEAISYINRKLQTGKGKLSNANDDGHKLDVYLTRFHGKNYYFALNKGLRDTFMVAEIAMDLLQNNPQPFKKVIHKLSPIIQMSYELMTGKTMTGFDKHYEKRGAMISSLLDSFMPMVEGGNSLLGVFPVSSGMSRTRLKEELTYAWEKQDTKKIASLMEAAANNGISGGKVLAEVRGAARAQKKFEVMRNNGAFPGVNQMLLDKMGVGNVPSQAAKEAFNLISGFSLRDLVGAQLGGIKKRLETK